MDPRNLLFVLIFGLGVLATEAFHRSLDIVDTASCGTKPGHTTLITKDDGDLICIYRQNGWPFKTTSGRDV